MYPGEEISEALLRDLINDSWIWWLMVWLNAIKKECVQAKAKSIAHFSRLPFLAEPCNLLDAKLLSHGVFMDIISVALKRIPLRHLMPAKNLPRNRPSRSNSTAIQPIQH